MKTFQMLKFGVWRTFCISVTSTKARFEWAPFLSVKQYLDVMHCLFLTISVMQLISIMSADFCFDLIDSCVEMPSSSQQIWICSSNAIFKIAQSADFF
jgi:hypothetical protein